MSYDRTSWVAFDANGFPFGFALAAHCTLVEVAKDWPNATRIELVEHDAVGVLLGIHAGGAEG